MKKYIYRFNKPADVVLNSINNDIKNKEFVGSVSNSNVELQRICDGYRHPSSYKLTAVVEENSSGCVLNGTFKYVTSRFVIVLLLAVIIVSFSAFMALAYTSDIGKYLLFFSAVIIVAYNLMALLKRREVITQTEKLFDEINARI